MLTETPPVGSGDDYMSTGIDEHDNVAAPHPLTRKHSRKLDNERTKTRRVDPTKNYSLLLCQNMKKIAEVSVTAAAARLP